MSLLLTIGPGLTVIVATWVTVHLVNRQAEERFGSIIKSPGNSALASDTARVVVGPWLRWTTRC
jgi:hypothetical protein